MSTTCIRLSFHVLNTIILLYMFMISARNILYYNIIGIVMSICLSIHLTFIILRIKLPDFDWFIRGRYSTLSHSKY